MFGKTVSWLRSPNPLVPSGMDLGLLVLRISFGLHMLVLHGYQKFLNYSDMSDSFPDPLGVGTQLSLSLAIFSELVCSALLILGLFTRAALIPLIITMLVAVLIIHADDPWAKKELAFVYLSVYIALFLTGPGRYSVDAKLR